MSHGSKIVPETPGKEGSGLIGGLDGLRAVSFLGVLFYHAHFQWMSGGYLGVEVFFVISGYLITGLLVKEYARTGRIGLRAFWGRRLRRLLPALLAFIFCISTLGLLFLGAQASQFRRDLLASLLYVENWQQLRSGSSYFADQGYPLLRHLWSLSVEGQFYLVWPFLVAALCRPLKGRLWPLAVLTGLLAAASFGLMLHLADPGNPSSARAAESLNRAYLGTDTRAFGLLAGALLALTLGPGKPGRGWDWVLNLGSMAALAGLGLLMVRVDAQAAFLYRGGFLVVDLLCLLVIASLVRPSATWARGLLGWGPLEWIGKRSYGLYLWHWPVFRLLEAGREGWERFALRVLVTLAIAELSYRCLEVPIRQGALERWFPSRLRTGAPWYWRGLSYASLPLVASLAFGEATVLARRPPYVDPVEASIRAGAAALDNHPVVVPLPEPLPPQAPERKVPLVLPVIPDPEGLRGLTVTAIGDSVMKGAALSFRKAGEARLGPGLIQINAEECRSFFPALEIVREYKQENRLGDVVVIHLGTNNSSISAEPFRRLMATLADRKLVLFLTVKSDKTSACDAVNRTLETLLADYPNARIFDWRADTAAHPEFFYPDQTHLRPGGAQYYAEIILAQISKHTRGEAGRANAALRVE